MKHDPEDFERTTMPEQVARADKRVAGRTPAGKTPVDVRGHHVDIDAHHREYVRERLGHKLGKYARAIERIHVRFEDLNGPKGGVAYEVAIHVVISGIEDVIVKEREVDPMAAFDVACDRVEVAMKHQFGKAWHEPVQAARRIEEERRGEVDFILQETASAERTEETSEREGE